MSSPLCYRPTWLVSGRPVDFFERHVWRSVLWSVLSRDATLSEDHRECDPRMIQL